tara:strand:+ start:52 stop:1407 length:1356 start_codon:yes stop_codon:yes gene_type:complete
MSHNNHETSTDASRILFLSSADGTNISGDPRLTTDFRFQLEQPIVVPPHHAILMSLHRTSIPMTFYNFQRFRNCALNVSLRKLGAMGSDVSSLNIHLEQANYNALDIANLLEDQVNAWLGGASITQLGTITDPIASAANGQNISITITFNSAESKFEWILTRGTNTTIESYFVIFRWESGADNETSIKDEIGFINNVWIDGLTYDFFCSVQIKADGGGAAGSQDIFKWGAVKKEGGDVEGDYFTLKTKNQSDFPTAVPADLSWSGNIFDKDNTTALPDGTTLPANTLKAVFSCVDVNFHVRSLYIKTNLTQHSVLNSKHGGRFSSILARLPNVVDSGNETLEIHPSDGIQHKLLLKVRDIDKVFVRLTDVNNRLIDLNGLDWNLSLQFDFIETPEVIHQAPDLRTAARTKVRDHKFNKEEQRLRTTGKKKELDEFLKIKETEKFSDLGAVG